MRYSKSEDIIQLATMMAASAQGISLEDISDHFKVSRRTAERMRDALGRIYELKETIDDQRKKRWVIKELPKFFLNPEIEEISALESAKKLFLASQRHEAELIDRLIFKLKAQIPQAKKSSFDTDIEALTEMEGIAIRPTPRIVINQDIWQKIRHATLANKKLKIEYKSRLTGKVSTSVVSPYGFLYGYRHYMVADNNGKPKLYSLGEIINVEELNEYFTRDNDFTLKTFAENSFGTFQEKPFNIAWRFSADVAAEVKNHIFHPSQIFEAQKDGSVIVKFRAGGLYAMAWYLFTWGDKVKIIGPKELKKTMKECLKSAGKIF